MLQQKTLPTRGDGRHLPENQGGPENESSMQCPSYQPNSICCPCEPGSPSARIIPVNGPQLSIVPSKLIPTRIKEWDQNVDEVRGMTPWIAHNTATKHRRSHRLLKDNVLSKAKMRLRIQDVGDYLKAYAENQVAQEEEKPLRKRSTDVLSHSTNIYLTKALNTAWAMEKRQIVMGPSGNVRIKNQPGPYVAAFHQSVIWPRVFRDEFHEEKRSTTKSLKALRSLRGEFQPGSGSDQEGYTTPATWFMSGTPSEVSSRDLADALGILERPEWETGPQLGRCTEKAVERLGRTLR
ncbi:hypothetical protein EYZ11_010969 [Aspergillus tanneri]|uniref:Uncharacterized protein n=1 Tax=Aspergillus tanneri TaxID=1220188 RepID=A0A4S3J406_9EURO|nr:hypothetical protein EYZ11_010969 [Aspergillus tanneri]